MDINNIVSTDYVDLSPETPISKLVSVFEDQSVNGVVVRDDEFEGVVTRRQLATSHHHPDQKVGSLVWHVPRLSPDEDILKVAQLMIDSDSQLLPVFEGQELSGVVTADAILQEVHEFLDAATVAEGATTDLVTLDPDSTLGQALNLLRENRITHLPVVDENSPVGILSLYDVTDVTVRSVNRSQGGDGEAIDSVGGETAHSTGPSGRGGFGAREGEADRLLDLPVRDMMASPVRTISPSETLKTAVETMFEIDGSSLVVTDNGSPHGIVTKTDILDALTWEAGGNRSVQVYGVDLIDDMDYDEIVAIIDKLDTMDHSENILDAKIHLQKHHEKHRGTPLLLARVRLHTDQGLYIASGEGYGASHALNEAREVLERQVRDSKTYGKSKKPPSEEFWDKRFGWLLEGEG